MRELKFQVPDGARAVLEVTVNEGFELTPAQKKAIFDKLLKAGVFKPHLPEERDVRNEVYHALSNLSTPVVTRHTIGEPE